MIDNNKTRLMIIGAHPDDCDINAGGIALKVLKNGGEVAFVSVTSGNAGHHELSKDQLRMRRFKETQNIAKQFGITYIVMENDDAYLQNTIKNRDELISIIRSFKPTVIATHRPYDYHTDHRNASMIVQDASFLLRVPLVCPNKPALEYDPVILYMSDEFKKPCLFTPGVVVDITDVNDDKVTMLHNHQSQFYEWLPWIGGELDKIPDDENGRLEYTKEWLNRGYKDLINDEVKAVYRKIYGECKDEDIKYVEAFEVCEYGGKASFEDLCSMLYVK